jgi:hypothetical protein
MHTTNHTLYDGANHTLSPKHKQLIDQIPSSCDSFHPSLPNCLFFLPLNSRLLLTLVSHFMKYHPLVLPYIRNKKVLWTTIKTTAQHNYPCYKLGYIMSFTSPLISLGCLIFHPYFRTKEEYIHLSNILQIMTFVPLNIWYIF